MDTALFRPPPCSATLCPGDPGYVDLEMGRILAREESSMPPASAVERARRDGKVQLGGRVYVIPSVVLVMRDVAIFSVLGLALGVALDVAFSYTPYDSSDSALMAFTVLQLNINGLLAYGAMELYQRVWYRNADTYVGFTMFMTVLLMCQAHMNNGIGAMSVRIGRQDIDPAFIL